MTRKQVIDEIPDDRVWLVSEFSHNAADQHTGATVPFEINHPVRFAGAVNFGPAMRTARSLMFGGHELEFPFEVWIAHDLVAQRSTPAGDYLNHCLHRALRFNSCALFCNACLGIHRLVATSPRDLCARLTEARLQKRAKHDVNIDISFFRVPKSAWQNADDFETDLFPEANGSLVRRDNKIELHRAKAKPARLA